MARTVYDQYIALFCLVELFYGLPFWASQLWLCSAGLMYVVMPVCTPTDCECYRLVPTTY